MSSADGVTENRKSKGTTKTRQGSAGQHSQGFPSTENAALKAPPGGACDPDTQDTEAGGSRLSAATDQVQRQPGVPVPGLFYLFETGSL